MGRNGVDLRLGALWRFAIAISVFNLLGHLFFGFEQSYAYPLVALATAYLVELTLETVDARRGGRAPRFIGGGVRRFVEFMLPAHITGLAVSMLLYAGARLMPVAFGAAVAIASKYVFRVPVGGRPRHFFNPSNLGITVTLLTFHWVGIAAPYMFTENLHDAGDWILPLVLVCAGSFLNARFTKRLPLIVTWLSAFALQAAIRAAVHGTPVIAALLPLTGMSLLLFTFYMVSDPSTTPVRPRGQVAFAAAVAAVYGLLVSLHVVFGMFFALSVVCLGRGILLAVAALRARQRQVEVEAPAAVVPLPAQRGFAAFEEPAAMLVPRPDSRAGGAAGVG